MKKNRPHNTWLCSPIFATLVSLLYVNCNGPFQPQKNPGAPIVVITFDDADPSVYSYAFPTMRSVDSSWGATHFLPVTYALPGGTVTIDQLKEMEAFGWETGGHGYTHENLSSVPLDSAEKQIRESHDFLAGNGLCHESFAYPTGNYNADVAALVKK